MWRSAVQLCLGLQIGVANVVKGVNSAWDYDSKPSVNGGLAQLARAPALHAGGQGFDPLILHHGESQVSTLKTEQ